MTVFEALGGVVDVAAALAAVGLLALGGTIAFRNRRPGPVRVGGRVVRQSRLVATWMVTTGVWGVLVAGKRVGLIPVSGLLILALVPVCLGLLALLLLRTQRGQLRPAPTGPAKPAESAPAVPTGVDAAAPAALAGADAPAAADFAGVDAAASADLAGADTTASAAFPSRDAAASAAFAGRDAAAVGSASLPKAREPAPAESADLEKTS